VTAVGVRASFSLDALTTPSLSNASSRFYGCDVDSAGDLRSVRSLECEECGRVSPENERGSTAHLTDDEPEEVVGGSLL
jgi:hypothetical protein